MQTRKIDISKSTFWRYVYHLNKQYYPTIPTIPTVNSVIMTSKKNSLSFLIGLK